MANEISVSSKMTLVNGGLKSEKIVQDGSMKIDQASAIISEGTVLVDDAMMVDVPKGNISSIGLVWFKNLDPTTDIYIGCDSGGLVPAWRLKPGEAFGPIRSAIDNLKAQADGAPANLQYAIWAD